MTGFGIGDALQAAEDFLRRSWKSKAVRAAEKRRNERRSHQSWLRMRRAAAFGGVSAAGALGAAILLGAAPMAAVAAAAAGVAGLAVSGMVPARRGASGRLSREELEALPRDAEEWLLDQRLLLPPAAAAPFDAILELLGDLPSRLARLDPNATLAWEARRLIGDHLPTLVRAYCGLPAATRERDPEPRQRLVHGLETIAAELMRICEEASRDERMLLETRQRFLDSRYGDGRLSER